MRFFVETNELNAGISTVIKALPARTTVNILEGIYLKAAANTLLMRCSDLSIQIETVIAATVEQEGEIVLPGKLFAEMVRKLTGEMTSFDVKKSTASIESGRFKTTLQGENGADFHTMSSVKAEMTVSIRPDALKRMVRGCIFAAAQDDSKPILTGALMEVNENGATLVALDGYRLALRREGAQNTGNQTAIAAAPNMIIPARSLVEIARVLPDAGEDVSIVFSRTHIMTEIGPTAITARLMEGEFIKYKQILPESHVTRVRVNRKELMEGIDRVALMARESKSNLIKFTIANSIINITANSEIGRSVEDVEASVMGADIEIAFNARYFTDVLRVLDEEEIFLDMINNISPCVVRPVQGESFYYLILPVRIFSGM